MNKRHYIMGVDFDHGNEFLSAAVGAETSRISKAIEILMANPDPNIVEEAASEALERVLDLGILTGGDIAYCLYKGLLMLGHVEMVAMETLLSTLDWPSYDDILEDDDELQDN